jgi:hypothetical protein
MFSRGGPYPSPLFFARRPPGGESCWEIPDESAEGAVDTKAEAMPRLLAPAAREDRVPRKARFDLENFIAWLL